MLLPIRLKPFNTAADIPSRAAASCGMRRVTRGMTAGNSLNAVLLGLVKRGRANPLQWQTRQRGPSKGSVGRVTLDDASGRAATQRPL